MADLVIHIGGQKTGSTAIQDWLFSNQHALQGQRVHVAGGLTDKIRNPAQLPLMFTFDPESWYCKRYGITNEAAYHQHFAPLRKSLAFELENSSKTSRLTVLSSEHASFMLNTEHKVKTLRDALSPRFKRIRIIHYFRDPISLCRASFSQAVRGEYTGTYRAYCQQKARRPDRLVEYEALATRWSDLFGVNNCEFRVYDRQTLAGNDVRQDFAQLLDLESDFPAFTPQMSSASPINPSLKFVSASAFRRVNIEFPYWLQVQGKTRVNPLNKMLKDEIEKLLPENDTEICDPTEAKLLDAVHLDLDGLGRYTDTAPNLCFSTAQALIARQPRIDMGEIEYSAIRLAVQAAIHCSQSEILSTAKYANWKKALTNFIDRAKNIYNPQE